VVENGCDELFHQTAGATSMVSLSRRQVFVGLDYHQSGVQVCVMDQAGKTLQNSSVANEAKTIAAVVRRHGEDVLAAVECCCGAANLAKQLADLGWNISLAHAGFVARMKQNPDKTDLADARILADLVRVGYLPKVWLAPDDIVELRRIVRFRRQLVAERRDVKLRIRALLRDERIALPAEQGKAWTKSWLKQLTQVVLRPTSAWILEQQLERLQELSRRIDQVEKRLQLLADQDAVIQKLLSLKGIGLITAVTLRAEVAQFERFRSGKQLARYCGLSPRNASSGERESDSGLIKAGNPYLRAVMIEAAQRLLWHDTHWQQFAAALLRRGKPKSVVVAAVANRWVRRLFHQMQPQELAA
jgi:transposase